MNRLSACSGQSYRNELIVSSFHKKIISSRFWILVVMSLLYTLLFDSQVTICLERSLRH